MTAKPIQTAAEARTRFLEQVAPNLLETARKIANQELFLDEDDVKSFAIVYKTLDQMVVAVGDIARFNVQNSASVLQLLQTGKIGIDDAMKLMDLAVKHTDSVELSSLADAVSAIRGTPA
jgi:hypothetical protein